MTECMWELTKAQQRMVGALVLQRQQVLEDGNRQIAEINEALDEAREMFASKRGLDPAEVEFANAESGEIVLKKREPEPKANDAAEGKLQGSEE